MFTVDDFDIGAQSEDSKKWPFSAMNVDEIVHFSFSTEYEKAVVAQHYAHVYGGKFNKKFKTKKIKRNDEYYMVIMRVS